MKIKVVCRKDKPNKNGQSPLFIRFTDRRNSKFVSIGLSVEPCYWDFEAQMLTVDCPERRSMQSKIDNEIDFYLKKIKRLEALEIAVTFDTPLESNSRKVNCTLSDCFTREINRLESLGKYNTASKAKVAFSLIGQFRNPNIRLEEIDLAYLNDFELFLRKSGNMDNCIATRFSVFKAVYNKALAEELFTPKPIRSYKVSWDDPRIAKVQSEREKQHPDNNLRRPPAVNRTPPAVNRTILSLKTPSKGPKR
jgi:hypothetical protein